MKDFDISWIDKEIAALQAEREKIIEERYHGKKIHGFTISSKPVRGVRYYQAFRQIDGKQYIVHIGRYATQAEKKIRLWLGKNAGLEK